MAHDVKQRSRKGGMQLDTNRNWNSRFQTHHTWPRMPQPTTCERSRTLAALQLATRVELALPRRRQNVPELPNRALKW